MRESPAPPPPFKNDLNLIIHINKQNQYQHIQRLKIHLFTILKNVRARSLQKIMQHMKNPILPTTKSSTPIPPSFNLFIFIMFFPSFSKFDAIQNKYSVSVYLEINFPSVPMVKINNMSQQNLSAPPPLTGRPPITWHDGSFKQMFVLFNENVTSASWEMISKQSPN